MRDRIRMWQHPDDPMNDDPNMDGASLLIVGEQILSAGRERPALGLALARARERPSDPGMWYIGTRMAHQRAATTSDVRFEGGAPPLSALARRIEGGEFGRWFVELKPMPTRDACTRCAPLRAAASGSIPFLRLPR